MSNLIPCVLGWHFHVHFVGMFAASSLSAFAPPDACLVPGTAGRGVGLIAADSKGYRSLCLPQGSKRAKNDVFMLFQMNIRLLTYAEYLKFPLKSQN